MNTDELAVQIQNGHNELLPELWEQVQRLVSMLAHRYLTALAGGTYGIEHDDLMQSGYLAMSRALEEYDPSQGKFTTYLGYYIHSEFRIAIGRSDRQLRDPLNKCRSLDEPINKDEPDGAVLMDTIPDPHDYAEEAEHHVFIKELRRALDEALATLPAREATVVRSYYYDGQTQAETAEQLGVTHQRVKQLRDTGLHHLRTGAARKQLEQFVDFRTDFYRPSSVERFQRTHSSVVEELVIFRDRLRRRYENALTDSERERYSRIMQQADLMLSERQAGGHYSASGSEGG